MTKANYIKIIQITAILIAVVGNVFALSEKNIYEREISKVSQVVDTLQLKCPQDISTYTDINECLSDISYGLNLPLSDNLSRSLTWELSGATIDESRNSGINQLENYKFNEGTTTVTYTLSDSQNNLSTCSFTVLVSDNQVPRLANPFENITITTSEMECGAFVPWDEPIVIDNCTPSNQMLIESSHNPGDFFPLGTTEVFYRINDGIETNDLTFSFLVSVVDYEIPKLTAPENLILSCSAVIPAAYTSWAEFSSDGGIAFDNCEVDYTSFRYVGQSADNINCPYTITRTYSIEDENGNVAEIGHLFYVERGEVPVKPVVVLKSAMDEIAAVKTGDWNDPTVWSTGEVPTASDNVTIGNNYTVTVNVAAVCQNITIQSGSTLNHSGTTTLQVYGNWINNGTYDGGTNGVVEFTGTNAATINGSTNFEGLIFNKGSLTAAITINGTVSVLSSGSLTMTSGLVTIPGSGSLTISPSVGLVIQETAGFDVTGGTLTTGNFSITNEGLIRVSTGTANFGTSSGNEVHIQFDGAFIVSGGNINIGGRLENTAAGTLTPPGVTSGINITGGTVTLCTVGNGASSTGSLNVTSAGNFIFTGGTIVFQRPSNATTELDLGLLSGTGTKNTIGGIFTFGNVSTPANTTFNIASDITLDRITSHANADLILEGNLLVNNLSLDNATTIDLNGFALQLEITGNGTYIFPIDDGSGNSIPVAITLNSGSLGANPYIEVTSSNGSHPQNQSSTNYLSRYWAITLNDITNPDFDISAEYPNIDISGTESEIAMGVWNGSLPWVKYGAAASNTISATGITTTSFEFTGITLDDPTVEINNGDASVEICAGSSTTLTAVATGDPVITYSWNPSTGLSADNISNPIANPSSTTIYTVTVTDGNGFTASDNINVIVNALPVVSASAAVCVGSTITLSPTTGGTWISSNNSYATVTNAGVVTGVAAGSVTFTFTETATGCSNTTSSVTVNALPTVTFSALADVCVDAAVFALSGGLPAGGTYSGTGVSGGNFDPSTAGVGTHTITYTYNDGNGCTDFATADITVNPLPVITFTKSDVICAAYSDGSINLTVTGGTPGYTYSWTTGDGSGLVATDEDQTGLTAGTYTVVVTDANGCTETTDIDIIISDSEDPVITCPVDILITNRNPKNRV